MRGFKEIHEIKSPEKISSETANHESENFRKIKPESGITVEEAQTFWDGFFASLREEGSN